MSLHIIRMFEIHKGTKPSSFNWNLQDQAAQLPVSFYDNNNTNTIQIKTYIAP